MDARFQDFVALLRSPLWVLIGLSVGLGFFIKSNQFAKLPADWQPFVSLGFFLFAALAFVKFVGDQLSSFLLWSKWSLLYRVWLSKIDKLPIEARLILHAIEDENRHSFFYNPTDPAIASLKEKGFITLIGGGRADGWAKYQLSVEYDHVFGAAPAMLRRALKIEQHDGTGVIREMKIAEIKSKARLADY
jgi:hypothetical protein